MTDFKTKMAELAAKYNISHKRDIEWHNFVAEVEQLTHPELAESEDERIRKRIRLCLDECVHSDIIRDYERDEVLAYLEKQKEQKPVEGNPDSALQKIKRTITDCKKLSEHYKDTEENFYQYYGGKAEGLQLALTFLGNENEQSQSEQKPAESKSHLTVQGKGVYKICPRCKERMVRDDSKVYTSMPPQYGYECPKCGEIEFDTTMYDNPEMEEQKPVDEQFPPLEGLDAIKAKYYDDGFKNGFDEGVESVKPAEWKPQPESLEALMYAIEGKWEAIKPTSYLSRRLEDLYDGLVNTFNVDESFIAHENDYVSKSAEWSEEDRKNLELVIDCIYDLYPDPVMKYKLKDWLKSLPERLNLQPKNEWSEEDRKKIHFLSRLIEFQVKDDEYCFGDGRLISKQEAISMLKSLRPSWKPSEEQMKALLNAEGYLREGDQFDSAKSIAQLYEQLKKL